MENLKVNSPKKDEKENLNQNSTYHQQGIKSFTPPPSGIQPVTGPLKPNIIQKMQALPENERPAYFQPNIIQRMQSLPEEQRPKILQPNIIQRIQRKQQEEHALNKKDAPDEKEEEDLIGEKTIQASSNETVTIEKTIEQTSDENDVDPSTIKTEDVKYELIAHGLAYQKTIPNEGNKLLSKWGYFKNWQETIDDENSSLFAGLIIPYDNSTLSPIIAFKGTLEGKDFMADGDPYAVGYTTFMLNRSKILSTLLNHSKVGGRKVDVVGHSLGGALAKHCAVEFPDRIGRVVTFQAPGVNPEQAEQFNKLKNKPSVTSHIAEGDVVDTAGRGQLQGEIYKHYLPEDNQAVKIAKDNPLTMYSVRTMDAMAGSTVHFDYLLSSNMYSKQQKELLPEGWNMQNMINAVKNPKDKDKAHPFQSTQNPTLHKEYPHPYKGMAAEFGRKTLGALLRTQADVVCRATKDDIASMPVYAQINMIRNFINYRNSDQAQNAITRIICFSTYHLAIFLTIGIQNIFNAIESEPVRKVLLVFLKNVNYYNSISLKDQIDLLNKALYTEMLSGHAIAMDLLLEIPAPHARVLITEIGKDMIVRYVTKTHFNAGLGRLYYLLPEYKSIIEANFPYDE